MKRICRNCHFLAKEYCEENTGRRLTFSLNLNEREDAKSNPDNTVKGYYTLKCHLGVWDEGVNPSLAQNRDFTLNNVNRKNCCFFFPYHSAMLFDAAKELQKRKSENAQLKKSNMYTRIGLWVAAGALLINAIIGYLRLK